MAELSSSQPDASLPIRERHCITLVKGDQRWRFQLEPGHERSMIDTVSGMASDPNHPLDWFDAAIVSHQIAKHLEQPGSTAPGASFDAA